MNNIALCNFTAVQPPYRRLQQPNLVEYCHADAVKALFEDANKQICDGKQQPGVSKDLGSTSGYIRPVAMTSSKCVPSGTSFKTKLPSALGHP